MKKTKKAGLIALMLFLSAVISACTRVASQDSAVSASSDDSDDNVYATDDGVQEEKGSLAINSRCTGCNHCAMIDSDHFSRSFGHSAPTVISQDNLDSSSLQAAISRCPANAISLDV